MCLVISSDHSYFKVCWWKTSSKCAEEVSCGKEGNLFVFTFSALGGRYAIKCWWQSHLRCQQSGYTLLFLSLSLFSYIKERDYITGCLRQDEVVYFAYGDVLYCTLWARKLNHIHMDTSSHFSPHKQSRL